ncbi:glutathione synthetase [Klebsiella pneumoniae]|uniref:Glutathione synthetase n=1 Tax=Klebsiella pneumoniae TaxID=573 RepID=A0A378BQS7_KLEPN|nr:glutathione synthetase [Klebsiella pneumoniae]
MYDFTGEQDLPLADLDVILMRKDPPFDTEFIYATYILERAEEKGTLIVNNRRVCATVTRSCSPPGSLN